MNILKMIKSLKAKGFATSAEKAELAGLVKELGDDAEAVAEEVAEVEALPEENPAEMEETKNLIKGLLSKEAEGIKSEVKKWLGEQAELKAKGAGVYNAEVKSGRKSLNAKFKAFCEATLTGSNARLKEMTTDGTGTPYAGYVVDSELSAEIRHLITEYGIARREMMTIQLSKNSYKANNLATDVSTFWTDEGGVIKSTQVVLGQEELELKKLGAIVSMTSELLADEEIDLFAFIGERIAEAFAKAEDDAFFNGDGTSTYGSFTGLLNNTSINEVVMTGTTFASISADDLINMADATPSGALANAKYYLHRTIMSFIRKLKDDNKQYIYQPISASGPATIWGYPVVLVEVMPSKTDTAADTSFVLFGDMKKACILGYKGGIEVKRFDAGLIKNVANNADINLITTDREAIRWTERVGAIVILPSAMTKLTTATIS